MTDTETNMQNLSMLIGDCTWWKDANKFYIQIYANGAPAYATLQSAINGYVNGLESPVNKEAPAGKGIIYHVVGGDINLKAFSNFIEITIPITSHNEKSIAINANDPSGFPVEYLQYLRLPAAIFQLEFVESAQFIKDTFGGVMDAQENIEALGSILDVETSAFEHLIEGFESSIEEELSRDKFKYGALKFLGGFLGVSLAIVGLIAFFTAASLGWHLGELIIFK